MGLVNSIVRGFATRASAGTPSYGMIPPLGSVQSASGLLVSQATAMTVAAVYAAGADALAAEPVALAVRARADAIPAARDQG